MSLPQPHTEARKTECEAAFVRGCITAVQRFIRVENCQPVLLIVGWNAELTMALKPYTRSIVVCDPHGPDYKCHSVRLRLTEPADMVILNLFHSATTNRWAPVYVMRDLLRRGVIRQFLGKEPYVVPRQSTTTLRVYEHPGSFYVDENTSARINWMQGMPICNTDYLRPVTERMDVLFEQYCIPEQSWPSHLSIQVPPLRNPLLAIVEYSLELCPGVYETYLATHRPDAKSARRLMQIGMNYFIWPQALGTTLHFAVAPKSIGGIQLTIKDEATASMESKLEFRKMDLALERLFGVLVTTTEKP